MDFKKYLEVSAHQIDQALEQVLSEFLSEVKKDKPKLTPFALGLINSCKGGKRIRGVLVKMGYEMVKPLEVEILRIGAAIEILHAAILIHDDVIDQSATRRNQPTLYKALGGDHYGISQAISLGDIGLYLPIKIIADANFRNSLKIKAIRHLSQTIIDTGWGEVLDVELSNKKETSLKDIILLYKLKTAQYTISGPLVLGSLLAGGEEDLIRNLEAFGEKLGIAFQIHDDILDSEVDYIGGVNNAKKEALKYVTLAKKVIPELTKDQKMSTLFEQMAEYLVQRTI